MTDRLPTGRPKRGDTTPRATERITVRLTTAERDKLNRMASSHGTRPGTIAASVLRQWLARYE